MSEELVIDIGIPPNSKEFYSFVGCIDNILEYGCGYDDAFTEEILRKCRRSELDIAKRVVSELEKPRSKYHHKTPTRSKYNRNPPERSNYNRNDGKQKWWETYKQRNIRKNTKLPTRQSRRPTRHPKRPTRHPKRLLSPIRPRSPMFEKGSKRPMSPMFEKGSQRPMSPMFERHSQRLLSPRFKRRRGDVPEWPVETTYKKRRF